MCTGSFKKVLVWISSELLVLDSLVAKHFAYSFFRTVKFLLGG